MRFLANVAEHFAAAGLIKTDRRIDQPYSFEHSQNAQSGEFGRQHRLQKAGRHERLRRQIVNFLRTHFAQHGDDRELIQKIGVMQRQLIGHPLEPFVDRVARTAHHAMHFVAAVQKKTGQVATVLARYAGNQSAF